MVRANLYLCFEEASSLLFDEVDHIGRTEAWVSEIDLCTFEFADHIEAVFEGLKELAVLGLEYVRD